MLRSGASCSVSSDAAGGAAGGAGGAGAAGGAAAGAAGGSNLIITIVCKLSNLKRGESFGLQLHNKNCLFTQLAQLVTLVTTNQPPSRLNSASVDVVVPYTRRKLFLGDDSYPHNPHPNSLQFPGN